MSNSAGASVYVLQVTEWGAFKEDHPDFLVLGVFGTVGRAQQWVYEMHQVPREVLWSRVDKDGNCTLLHKRSDYKITNHSVVGVAGTRMEGRVSPRTNVPPVRRTPDAMPAESHVPAPDLREAAHQITGVLTPPGKVVTVGRVRVHDTIYDNITEYAPMRVPDNADPSVEETTP